jgi:hypothetical protein
MEILIHNLSHSDIVFELLSYRSSSSSSSSGNDGEIFDYDIIMTRPKFSSFQIVTQHIYNHICNDNNDIDNSNHHHHHHHHHNSRSSKVAGVTKQLNDIYNVNDISIIKSSSREVVHNNINADIVNDVENNDDIDHDINNEQHQQQQPSSPHHHYSRYLHNNIMDIDLIMTKLQRRRDNDGQKR